jgi:hypothetical protein
MTYVLTTQYASLSAEQLFRTLFFTGRNITIHTGNENRIVLRPLRSNLYGRINRIEVEHTAGGRHFRTKVFLKNQEKDFVKFIRPKSKKEKLTEAYLKQLVFCQQKAA